jgi:2-C-methyl-D-erythritol 4-phosphate cytidylyltransferase
VTARAAVVIPAAGVGRRFGGVLKPFADLAGQPVLQHTLSSFLADPRVRRIVIALPNDVADEPPAWLATIDARVTLVRGGAERGDSVHAALRALPDDIDVVLVHDAARPLVSADLIDRAIRAAAAGESVIAAVPATDTVQQVDTERRIVATPDRATLWLAQTPQAFPRDVIVTAYNRAAAEDVRATDDAALVLRYGGTVRVIEGEPENVKITVPIDHVVAEALLLARRG